MSRPAEPSPDRGWGSPGGDKHEQAGAWGAALGAEEEMLDPDNTHPHSLRLVRHVRQTKYKQKLWRMK